MKLCLKCNTKLKSHNTIGYCRFHRLLSSSYIQFKKEYEKRSYEKNKDKRKVYAKQYWKENSEKYKIYRKQYEIINADKIREYKQRYRKENKDKIYKQTRNREIERLKNDPLFKLAHNLRVRTKKFLNLKKWNKNFKYKQYIGCTQEELKQHLEQQFKSGMSWDNYNYYGWHIDHIIPLSSAKTEDEMFKLLHYTNLQPLWRKENMSKGNKIMAAKRLRLKDVKA